VSFPDGLAKLPASDGDLDAEAAVGGVVAEAAVDSSLAVEFPVTAARNELMSATSCAISCVVVGLFSDALPSRHLCAVYSLSRL
jgi:Na+/H+ antiporter NhaA